MLKNRPLGCLLSPVGGGMARIARQSLLQPRATCPDTALEGYPQHDGSGNAVPVLQAFTALWPHNPVFIAIAASIKHCRNAIFTGDALPDRAYCLRLMAFACCM